MDPSRLCILMPTCESYLDMARFTCHALDRLWANHPPVFMCGVPGAAAGDGFLPSDADARDWMGGVRCATRELTTRGFEEVYLILDDHPPFGSCHSRHLNETLPRLLKELQASFISLQGWGPGRLPVTGEILDAEHYAMERQPLEQRWKFSLHPGLWSLPVLDGVCAGLMAGHGIEDRSAWAFERRSGAPDAPLPDEWKLNTYRVCGTRMISPLRQVRFMRLRLERFFCHVIRYALGSLRMSGALAAFDNATTFLFDYYEGAYPLFHSGLLARGCANFRAVRFLRGHGTRVLRSGLARVLPDSPKERKVRA